MFTISRPLMVVASLVLVAVAATSPTQDAPRTESVSLLAHR